MKTWFELKKKKDDKKPKVSVHIAVKFVCKEKKETKKEEEKFETFPDKKEVFYIIALKI